MQAIKRMVPRSISAQIAMLVIAAVFLGDIMSSGFVLLVQGDPASPDRVASRIAVITDLARSARSAEETRAVLTLAQRSNIVVKEVPLRGSPAAAHRERSPFAGLVVALLKSRWQIAPLANQANDDSADSIVVPVGATALAFETGTGDGALLRIGGLTGLALLVVSLFVALVAIYAVRSITAPLSFIAAAARAFGHSPSEDEVLPERGPTEIAQVARALNEMRNRIRALIDERTRMLAAISHDLRTPLTRLRLRAERIADSEARDGMLREVELIDALLGEALVYLRDARTESTQRTDLPSLLQTICAEFTDVGHSVTYRGPQRLTFACRPRTLTRAVRNVVDNGVKHGSEVTLQLSPPTPGDARLLIEISDDGPGIATAMRGAVFEPFFKGDSARTVAAHAGFGLGLSIARDIIRDHGGTIELLDREPTGLNVRVVLPVAIETSLNDT